MSRRHAEAEANLAKSLSRDVGPSLAQRPGMTIIRSLLAQLPLLALLMTGCEESPAKEVPDLSSSVLCDVDVCDVGEHCCVATCNSGFLACFAGNCPQLSCVDLGTKD